MCGDSNVSVCGGHDGNIANTFLVFEKGVIDIVVGV